MTTQERISKLQGLLTRIQKNASRPRGNAAMLDAPRVAASAPVVPTAPFAAHPAPPPVAFASPAPLPAAPPPPIPTAVTAPAAYSAPQTSADDQSVDDLLGAPDDAMPVDIDVPLDTIPPVAVTSTQAPESEPIPLVASAKEPLPPPIDDAFGLESEVSEVRMAPAPRESDVEVTVAAIEAEAEAEIIATEELSEADLVELTESTITTGDADVDIDFEEEEEQPPASSQRSRVASSMDEALAAAAEHNEAEHDVPLKTPPPESGPQAAPVPTPMAAAPAPDVDALLGEELELPMREAGRSAVPTAEQLGQTIELEEARGPSLELAEPAQSSVPPAPIEELEVALPARDVVGGYDDSLMPPPEARDDLEAHRRRQEDDLAPPPESLAQLPSIQPGAGSPEIVPLPRTSAPVQPEIVARPAPTGTAQSFTSGRESFKPASFVELLDASLSLGGD
jgi:hypothetical protein